MLPLSSIKEKHLKEETKPSFPNTMVLIKGCKMSTKITSSGTSCMCMYFHPMTGLSAVTA